MELFQDGLRGEKAARLVEQNRDWHRDLFLTGSRYLEELQLLINQGDPQSLVHSKPKFLCCALAQLSLLCYESLGGRAHMGPVGRAGAMLAILTKIDDQVIDGLPFHGGRSGSFKQVRQKTKDYLAPTLESIKTGRAANSEGRCVLAARLGAELQLLARENHDRLDLLLDWIERGWDIQAEAVATLTRHGSEVTMAQVEKVTRDISGAWLLMISAIGSLPSDAARVLTDDEVEAFYDLGWHIQRADSLADMAKDIGDGLISSYPDKWLYSLDRDAYERCVREANEREVYSLCASLDIDKRCMPEPGEFERGSEALGGLGGLGDLLAWIHGFLTWRYLVHPLSLRTEQTEFFRPFIRRSKDYKSYLGGVAYESQGAPSNMTVRP